MYIDTTCSPTVNQPWTIGDIIIKQPLIIINQLVADYMINHQYISTNTYSSTVVASNQTT